MVHRLENTILPPNLLYRPCPLAPPPSTQERNKSRPRGTAIRIRQGCGS